MALDNLQRNKKEFFAIYSFLNKYFHDEAIRGDALAIINKLKFPVRIDVDKEYIMMVKEDLICAVLILLIKTYNKVPTDAIKQSFYDLYNLWQIDYTGRLWFEIDSLGLSEIRIPLNQYFPLRLFDLKHPNTTIIYEVDKDIHGYDLEDIVRCRDDGPNSKVVIEFPKNFKFSKFSSDELNLIKFQWPNKDTIVRFYPIKDKDGDDCLPFKLIYIDDQKDLLNTVLQPIV